MIRKLILAGLGPQAKFKYLPMIQDAYQKGLIDELNLVELESARRKTEQFSSMCNMPVKNVVFVPDYRHKKVWFTEHSNEQIKAMASHETGVVISTEPKAHFGYMTTSMDCGLDCLVDKPIVLQTSEKGIIHSDYSSYIKTLLDKQKQNQVNCSVMTARRYSAPYRLMLRYILSASRSLNCPVTYIGIEHHEGVWNTLSEVQRREDHPYKYGYGMLCHSGYHFVDLLASFLSINSSDLESSCQNISMYTAPADHSIAQIPEGMLQGVEFAGSATSSRTQFSEPEFYGETDLTSSGYQIDELGRVQCLFNLNLLQTSVSLRMKDELPKGIYNRNGRLPFDRIRVNIGPLLSLEFRAYKRPRQKGCVSPEQFERTAKISLWRSQLARSASHHRKKIFQGDSSTFGGADFAKPRKQLFLDWLSRSQGKSSLQSHLSTAVLFDKLLKCAQARSIGNDATFDKGKR